ncbi:hypothetical protein [uncultured Campylobacter sp.]|uniref:hypothetical protein n=1 Tax=uncultured Campylobacter sp. TaxID=218934 RepID=UPI0026266DBB|nr:hypothetical protein [uncultured Campylobacter sp.]
MLSTMHIGAWVYNEDPTNIDEHAKSVFSKATKSFLGSDLELMLCLGSQLVSGKNYAFICRRKTVALNPKSAYSLVICYENLQGECSISKMKDVVKENKLKGGIFCTKSSEAFISKLDCIEANRIVHSFNKAFSNLVGVKYTPELYVAHSISTGINYHIIAKAKLSDKEQSIGYKYTIINSFMNEDSIVSVEDL